MRNVFIIWLFFSLLLITSCNINIGGSPHLVGPYQGRTDHCNFALNSHTGKRVVWESFPVTFYIHEDVPEYAARNFRSSMEDWNLRWMNYLDRENYESFELFNVHPGRIKASLDSNHMEDAHNVFYFIRDNFAPFVGDNPIARTQAVTIVRYKNQTIKEADLVVNETGVFNYFYDPSYDERVLALKKSLQQRILASSYDPTPYGFLPWVKRKLSFFLNLFKKKNVPSRMPASRIPRNQVDFPSLMIHEIGHVPGMGHVHHQSRGTEEHHSVMEEKLPSGKIRRTIKEEDLRNLKCGYEAE